MKLVLALWKRSRRGLFRAAAVVCALAAVVGGLTVGTASPARADQTITSDGPYAVTYSGGDLVASVRRAGSTGIGSNYSGVLILLATSPDMLQTVLAAESLKTIASHRFPAAMRRHYERLRRFPEGLLLTGTPQGSSGG